MGVALAVERMRHQRQRARWDPQAAAGQQTGRPGAETDASDLRVWRSSPAAWAASAARSAGGSRSRAQRRRRTACRATRKRTSGSARCAREGCQRARRRGRRRRTTNPAPTCSTRSARRSGRSTSWSTTPASRATGVFKRMAEATGYAVINTNLNSVFNVTRQVIDGMMERGWGRIINISSVNAIKGQFGQTNYSAAKAGMAGFSKALAQEVVKKGVTVNTVSPGYVETDMVMRDHARGPRAASWRRSRWGGSRGRRRSRRWWLPRLGRGRATSPARTSRSTAACTWSSRRAHPGRAASRVP